MKTSLVSMKALTRNLYGVLRLAPVLLALVASTAQADWPNTNATKFVQWPNITTSGIDVDATLPIWVADDFLCTNTGPITDIHLWCSWNYDASDLNTTFTLSIWSDVPANPPMNPYSHPGIMLTNWLFLPGQYNAKEVYYSDEQFLYPGEGFIGSDHQIWQYNFYPPTDHLFTQTGSITAPVIYWLAVTASPQSGTGSLFGWKTSTNHFKDYAVFSPMGPGNWKPIYTTPQPGMTNYLNLDLAFALTTTNSCPPSTPPTEPPPPETNTVKFVQMPSIPEGYDVRACGPIVLADDFVCTNTGPITDIHIWCSWLNDLYASNTPVWLGIYSDVPSGTSPSHPGNLIWSQWFAPGQYAPYLYYLSPPALPEHFYDPAVGAIVGQDTMMFYYSFYPSNPLTQTGSLYQPTIYWLAVYAQPPDQCGKFGWKTTFDHLGPDSAVWGHWGAGNPVGDWSTLIDPIIGGDLDLAFKITTQPCTPSPPPTEPPPPETNAVKFIQSPNLEGYDVRDCGPIVLADDFVCTKTGPITDIHIWCSWLNDLYASNTPVWLGIYTDVPAPTGGASHPGNLLWSQWFAAGEYLPYFWANAPLESFYDPLDPAAIGSDTMALYYSFYPKNPLVQTGSVIQPAIYWLAVYAQPPAQCGRFGWKTSLEHLAPDFAVWGYWANGQPSGSWNTLLDETGFPLDLAFAITMPTNPPPPPPPPEETNSVKFIQWPDRQNGLDVLATTPILLADDFYCTNTGPITDIHFWCSWLGDYWTTNATFQLGIWSDVPRIGPDFPSHPGTLLWTSSFGPGQYGQYLATWGDEQFYDPATTNFLGWDQQMHYYSFYPTNPFVQTGSLVHPTIYWLSVQASVPNGELFGWKTSTNHFNDDAVYAVITQSWSGTVASWPMDEGTGVTVHDSTVYANDGTFVGPAGGQPAWTTGHSSPYALAFPGGDYLYDGAGVSVPHSASLDITGPFAIQAWIKADPGQWYYAIVDKMYSDWGLNARGYTFYLTGGALRVSVYPGTGVDGDLFGATDLRDSQWHLVEGGFDGSSLYVKVDGRLDGLVPWTSPPASINTPLGIGKRLCGWGGYLPFLGVIDSVTIATSLQTGWKWTDLWDPRYQQSIDLAFKLTTLTNECPIPTIQCFDLTVECGAVWAAPAAWDNCCNSNLTPTLILSQTNGQCPWFIYETWLATDCKGQTNTCSRTVQVVDTTPPAITCASNIIVECGSAWDFTPPTAYDACCGTNVTVIVVQTVTNGHCPWVIIRTWQATDCCTNSKTCSQTVTVVDTKPPTLTCAPDKTVIAGWPWGFDPPYASDTCCGTNITVYIVNTVTNKPCPLSVTRTWGAFDCCTNYAQPCSQTVTVINTNLPPDDTNTVKFVQWPKLIGGYDVSDRTIIFLADDFRCTDNGPITDIHIWCSYLEDQVTNPPIWLGIWSDVPGTGTEYSHPGELLWQQTFAPDQYQSYFWDCGYEQWYDPTIQRFWPDSQVLYYVFYPTNAFVQQGSPQHPTNYWLSVYCLDDSWFGWKTSTNAYNDAAVWNFWPPSGATPWTPMSDPLGGEPLNMAFKITTRTTPGTVKFIQPPDLTTNGFDVRILRPKILADDFLCTKTGPVTNIHLWASWLGDYADPMAVFEIGFWTDVPISASLGPNLLINGTFESAFTNAGFSGTNDGLADAIPPGWNRYETFSGGVMENSSIGPVAENGPSAPGSQAVRFSRGYGGASGDWTAIFANLSINAALYTHLYLTMDVKVWYHNLEAGGTVTPAFEWPAVVQVDYVDIHGFNQVWRHGWYLDPPGDDNGSPINDPGQGLIPFYNDTLVPQGVWVPNNFDLFSELPQVQTIKRILVGGSGWDFSSEVDNVSIRASETNAFSHPDRLLWTARFGPGQYTWSFAPAVPQPFYDPNPPPSIIGWDTNLWQYDFPVLSAEAFPQTNGCVYWLSVSAQSQEYLGWKTAANHWIDDAVYGHVNNEWIPLRDWKELFDPSGTRSLDLAFSLTTPGMVVIPPVITNVWVTNLVTEAGTSQVVGLDWIGQSGVQYQVFYAPDLGHRNDGADISWMPCGPAINWPNHSYCETNALVSQRFYRIKAIDP
jgi:hypothetical protein